MDTAHISTAIAALVGSFVAISPSGMCIQAASVTRFSILVLPSI
jgi:hypothetical protein